MSPCNPLEIGMDLCSLDKKLFCELNDIQSFSKEQLKKYKNKRYKK